MLQIEKSNGPLFSVGQVFQLVMWMAHYNHPTPKRTLLVSNRREIALLGKGKLRGAKRHAAYKTAVQYQNRQGKRCYQGTPLLKQTQFLGKYCTKSFSL